MFPSVVMEGLEMAHLKKKKNKERRVRTQATEFFQGGPEPEKFHTHARESPFYVCRSPPRRSVAFGSNVIT